jgi:P-type Ca2+ transporter type 2C
MQNNPHPFTGLCDAEVVVSRRQNGTNALEKKTNYAWLHVLKETVSEPMFILLVACTVIYFSLGELSEGFFMLGAIILVSAISFYQESKSKKALDALKAFTEPSATVIRNNVVVDILSENIVLGDFVIVSEGELFPADGRIVQINDFSVNESILTGEAFAVFKDVNEPNNNQVYQGTMAQSGQCIFEVTAIGEATKLGQIGALLDNIDSQKTPLQDQIDSFVKKMAAVGAVIFFIIWGINYYQTTDILQSLLKGLTIAMSVLPEEIPVAFASFMALGAWRLMKTGIIVKHTQTVEALGSATVMCTDKTGTITENKMALFQIYVHETNAVLKENNWQTPPSVKLIKTAMFASESLPFDPMEKALHEAYETGVEKDERPDFKMIHEYPLSGNPPMMTHIFENTDGTSRSLREGVRIIACKGAPEALLAHSSLSDTEKEQINKQIAAFAAQGLRVLGVGVADFEGTDFPKEQQSFTFTFLGLVGFYDPPKPNIAHVFQQFYNAGIQVKIITGDNPLTTLAIAKQAKFKDPHAQNGELQTITGEALMSLNETDRAQKIAKTSIFTRMFPEAKLHIINTLKSQNQVVGMTGDGVNDGPALKAAHIGIAMGKRGSEIAKQAASLILMDDDIGKMVDAIAMGRKIYNNLKKAIQYIISIHIPIILTVALPLILGWVYPAIFTPVHVIFLELIMGPTCSIVYENEPLEKHSMQQPPRPMTTTFLNFKELSISILQGLIITAGTLFSYRYAFQQGCDENLTRTLVFTTLVIANVFLTLVNRSFYYSVWTSFSYKNNLIVGVISISIVLLLALIYVPIFASFFKLSPLNIQQFAIASVIGFASVIWFEGYKWYKRIMSYALLRKSGITHNL